MILLHSYLMALVNYNGREGWVNVLVVSHAPATNARMKWSIILLHGGTECGPVTSKNRESDSGEDVNSPPATPPPRPPEEPGTSPHLSCVDLTSEFPQAFLLSEEDLATLRMPLFEGSTNTEFAFVEGILAHQAKHKASQGVDCRHD